MTAEVDNWDLSVHRREVTHEQNRRNVQVGSLENQPKPRTGTDDFSCGANLLVQGCTRTNQTIWTEDQFVVTTSSGIRDRGKGVAEIVVRELEKAKPVKWDVYRLASFGHRRRRPTYVLDTTGC